MRAEAPPTALPVIPTLLARHAGDAAFYWQQHDRSVYSPLVGLSQLQEFDRLLDAHLDGLRVASDAGWDAALAELDRWGGANEAFVGATLGLASVQTASRLAYVTQLVQKKPERILRGLVGALVWAPPNVADEWCMQWVQPDTPAALTVAAWRTLAVASRRAVGRPLLSQLGTLLPSALAAPHPSVRAAACRAAACLDAATFVPLLQDPVREVRAEAAIGWLRQRRVADHQKTGVREQQHLHVVSVLWHAFYTLTEEWASLTGWYR